MAMITGLEGGWTKETGPGKEQPCTAQCRWGGLFLNLFSLSPNLQPPRQNRQNTQKPLSLQPAPRKRAERISSFEEQLQRGFGFAKDRGKLGRVPSPPRRAPPLAAAW